MSNKSVYDLIIVGAGHNGLTTAGYLAREGLNVLVLERRNIVGGACVTEELIPGFKFSTASMFCGMMQPKVIDDLELRKYGLNVYSTDPTAIYIFPDESYLCTWKDEKHLREEIGKFSKKDASTFIEMQRDLQHYQEYIKPYMLRTPPSLADLASHFKTVEEQEAYRNIMMGSAGEFARQKFESEAVRVMASSLAVSGNTTSIDGKGNLFKMLWASMAEATGDLGVWGYSRGGMGGITQAMAASAQAFGATIQTGVEIKNILIEDGKAKGVALKSGEEIKSLAVASNADPKRTFLNLVPGECLDNTFKESVGNIKLRGDFAKLFMALDGKPEWACFKGEEPGTKDHGFITIIPSLDYMEGSRLEAMQGVLPDKVWFLLQIQSLTDSTLAPTGQHSMTCYIQSVPYELSQGSWDDETLRNEFAEHCINILVEYAPNIRKILIDHVFLGPRNIEETFYLTESTMHHGDMFADQMFSFRPVTGWSDYRTPIQNLYLCGAGAFPGGGVSGAPGHNAAHEIIKDWREGVIA